MRFKSKAYELIERLRAEGKAIELSELEVAKIDEHLSREMRGFRSELLRKQAQSHDDTRRIILNA